MGVIVAPPGSGKTIIGLSIIAQKEQPALIIVHRKQLFDQWVERIQSFLGIAAPFIGKIVQGQQKIGTHITVAMIQSLAGIAAAICNKNIPHWSGIQYIGIQYCNKARRSTH